jgi:hypothetical protein
MSYSQEIYDAVRSRISGGNIAEAVERAIRDADIHHSAQAAAYSIQCAAAAYLEPSAIYRPSLAPDGNKWCALYGENLMEGVAGFGDTPAEAMAAFDKAWREEVTPTAARMARAIAEEEAAQEAADNGQFGVGA